MWMTAEVTNFQPTATFLYCHRWHIVKQPKVLVAEPKRHYVAIGTNIHLSKTDRLPPEYPNLSHIITT